MLHYHTDMRQILPTQLAHETDRSGTEYVRISRLRLCMQVSECLSVSESSSPYLGLVQVRVPYRDEILNAESYCETLPTSTVAGS